MIDLVGMMAAILTTASFFPQAMKTIKTRDTSGISLLMYLMFFIGVCFWLAYGILLGNTIIVIANFITLILAGTVLAIKIHNVSKF